MLLTVLWCLGGEVVPVSFLVDTRVASGSSAVSSFEGFTEVAFMKGLECCGGKIPPGR